MAELFVTHFSSFKLSTRKSFRSYRSSISTDLFRCRGQVNFDVGIPISGPSVLGSKNKNEESTHKDVSRSLRLKCFNFKPNLSWETSIEQWDLGLLSWTSSHQTRNNPKPPVSKEKYRSVWLPPPKLFCYFSP